MTRPSRGVVTEVTRTPIDSGRRVSPVSKASKPSTDWVNTGMRNSRPAWANVCVDSTGSPAPMARCRKIEGCTRTGLPVPSRLRIHRTKTPSTTRPPMIMATTSGSSQPRSAVWRTPSTNSPRPSAESTTPTTSSLGFGSTGGASVSSPDDSRTPSTMIASPAKASRHVYAVVIHPPISGPNAAPAAATPKSTP